MATIFIMFLVAYLLDTNVDVSQVDITSALEFQNLLRNSRSNGRFFDGGEKRLFGTFYDETGVFFGPCLGPFILLLSVFKI